MLRSRLKQCRTAKGMSVKQLAALSDVQPSTIYALERARVITQARLDELTRLSKALGIPANKVFPDAKEGDMQSEDVLYKRHPRRTECEE